MMRILCMLLLGHFLLLLPVSCAAQTSPSCALTGWTQPVALFGDNGELLSPSLAIRDDSIFVLGNSMSNWRRWNTTGLRLARLGEGELPPPPGDFYFARPLAAFDRDGRLHVFWAEPGEGAEVPDTVSRPPLLTRLYHAVYLGDTSTFFTREGERVPWSTPRVVFEANGIQWYGRGALPLAIDRGGTLHLALMLWAHGSNRVGIVYLREEPGRSRKTTEFLDLPGLYSDLGLGPRSEVYLAVIHPMPTTREPDSNSVFFRRSLDRGHTWEAPVLVSRSGRLRAHDVRMAVTPAGQIHLMWQKNKSGGLVPEVLWHSVSDDGGRSWSDPRELSVPGARPEQLRVVADIAGRIHVIAVFLSDSRQESRLYFTSWSGREWSPLCAFDPGHDGLDPEIATDERGRVHVVWNRGKGLFGSPPQATAMHATLTP